MNTKKAFLFGSLMLIALGLGIVFAEEPGGGAQGSCQPNQVCCRSKTDCPSEFWERLSHNGKWWMCCEKHQATGHTCENEAIPEPY